MHPASLSRRQQSKPPKARNRPTTTLARRHKPKRTRTPGSGRKSERPLRPFVQTRPHRLESRRGVPVRAQRASRRARRSRSGARRRVSDPAPEIAISPRYVDRRCARSTHARIPNASKCYRTINHDLGSRDVRSASTGKPRHVADAAGAASQTMATAKPAASAAPMPALRTV